MKKKGFIIAGILVVIALIAGLVFYAENGTNITTFWFTEEITVTDGVAANPEHVIPFTLEEDGIYVVKAQWETEKNGMITGMVLRDATGDIKFCVTGECVDVESTELALAAGEYQVQYLFLTNEMALKSLVAEAGANRYDEDEEAYAYAMNENYEIEYHFQILKPHSFAYQAGVFAGMLVGVLFGLGLVALIFKYTKTDKRKEWVYDERQLQARGNGFKYGFFTSIIYSGVLSLLSMLDNMASIKVPVAQEVLLMFGILLTVFVYAVYCIQKEAYISLNESRSRLMTIFIVLGVMNTFIGIMHCIHGTMIENGMVTYHAINLMCGIFLLAIAVVLMVHGKTQGAEEE